MCRTITDIYTLCDSHHETWKEKCANNIAELPCSTTVPPPQVNIRSATLCSRCMFIRSDKPCSIPEEVFERLERPPVPPKDSRLGKQLRKVGKEVRGVAKEAKGVLKDVRDVAKKGKLVVKLAVKGPFEALRAMDGAFGHDGSQRVTKLREINPVGLPTHLVGNGDWVERNVVPLLDKMRA